MKTTIRMSAFIALCLLRRYKIKSNWDINIICYITCNLVTHAVFESAFDSLKVIKVFHYYEM